MLSKKEIYDRLASCPAIHKKSDIQLVTRCVLCGDSKKNQSKERLYIKVNIYDESEPIMYNCFNCFESGLLTTQIIQDIGIFDSELEDAIRIINKNAIHDDGTKVNRYKNIKEIKVELPPLHTDEKSLNKAKYLFSRIGKVINPEDYQSLRIVWNLREFLQVNDISIEDKDIWKIDMIDKDYIGFLSVHSEYIAFRDVTEDNKFRWIKYNIFDVVDSSHSFYTMKGAIDLLSMEDIHIVVTEGPLDLVSLRYNVFDNDIRNKIMISTCNGSFMNPIMYYIRKGFVGQNIKIDCYQDNDTRLNFKSIRSQLKPYIFENDNFTVYYNTLSKDFGVPKNKIQVDILNV